MIEWIILIAGVLTAVAGGFYFAFSFVVMPALRRRPPAEAGRAMVAINVQAVRAPFMIVFFGAAVASVAVLGMSLSGLQSGDVLRVVGALLSLLGWLSTVAVNVPMNNRLAAATDPAAGWNRFDRPWTRANHVRTVLCVGGAVALLYPVG